MSSNSGITNANKLQRNNNKELETPYRFYNVKLLFNYAEWLRRSRTFLDQPFFLKIDVVTLCLY